MFDDLDKYDIDEDALFILPFMDRILATVVNAYEANNVPLPARRYWMTGEPAIDCEQVVVSLAQIYLGRPGDEASDPRHCGEPRSAVVSIQVARETAKPKATSVKSTPPTAEEIQKAARWQAVDSWVLMESMDQFDLSFDGTPGLGVIATVQADPIQGGYASVTMSLTLAVS